jgi:hypothetical protein
VRPCYGVPWALREGIIILQETNRIELKQNLPDDLEKEERIMTAKELEKYSAAVSLSDMEVFIFPELMYSLVLANIMSPVLWKWREHETFLKLEGKSPYRKLMRMRQFIMDEYEFNLDLNTWGLTDKDVELKRFSPFLSPEKIAESNALFGYQGDEYYFDIGIRRHFGLDKYNGNVIPYWKTETVEAMDAFRYKQSYTSGAGECVSLAALYVAAAYVLCGIPLDDMFMILTPLHSQNYIDINDGIITNNRRLLTKAMWFNGTEITNKAQRALRNERVTIVSHNTGYIHYLYDDATISPQRYEQFGASIREYLKTELDLTIFANFLRGHSNYMKHFAFCRNHHGKRKFISARKFFCYEHDSKHRIAADSIDKLFAEVLDEDYEVYTISEGVICVSDFLKLVSKLNIDILSREDSQRLAEYIQSYVLDPNEFIDDLCEFVNTEPMLPEAAGKNFTVDSPLYITTDMSREEIIDYLSGLRQSSITADLAFYAYRDMQRCDWEPFIKASIERCPVCVEMAAGKDITEVYKWLLAMESASIYDADRLAHPDEVVNFSRGDGVEKAFCLATILNARAVEGDIELRIKPFSAVVLFDGAEYSFDSDKSLNKDILIKPDAYARPLITEA